MKLEIEREQLLEPLQHVIGVVERRQTLPILSNVLLTADEDGISLTATDMEVELSAQAGVAVAEPGETTLPGRKMLDILRALPEGARVSLTVEDNRATLRSGRSRFVLLTLPAADFPALDDVPFESEVSLRREALQRLVDRTQFAMAQQDVRYYLNGLLLEVGSGELRAVATDGHRLAYAREALESAPDDTQVIVPRKGVQELARLIGDGPEIVRLRLGSNHLQADLGSIRFTSKLIDGKFPDYQRVIPRDGSRVVVADRLVLRNALSRAAILSTDKFRGVRLRASDWLLHIHVNNPEQEEAEDEVEINYSGEALEIGFNVNYLIDALGALEGELVRVSFADAQSSCLLQAPESDEVLYVVMPMRL